MDAVKPIVCLLIPQLAGLGSGLLSGDQFAGYALFTLPPLSPPGVVFGIVWTLLYLLMGIALYLIVISESGKKKALMLYSIQLFLNFCWSLLFFRWEMRLFAFFWILLLLFTVFLTYKEFTKINRYAGYLLLPYMAWTVFAGYPALGVWLLN